MKKIKLNDSSKMVYRSTLFLDMLVAFRRVTRKKYKSNASIIQLSMF